MNRNELLVGLLLTLCLTPFMGVMGLSALVLCPLLWALSGMQGQDKIWRRLGVPLVWAICLWRWQAFLVVPIGFGFLCLGYGIPDKTDQGSALGRFFWKLTGGNVRLSNILTRGVIYTGLVIPFLTVIWIW
jgi:hypothetical protein